MAIPSTSNRGVDLLAANARNGMKSTPLKKITPESITKIDIIDIRHGAVEVNLKDEILSNLRPKSGPKKLPTLLLYDERGLQLFEEVTPKQSYCRNMLLLTGAR